MTFTLTESKSPFSSPCFVSACLRAGVIISLLSPSSSIFFTPFNLDSFTIWPSPRPSSLLCGRHKTQSHLLFMAAMKGFVAVCHNYKIINYDVVNFILRGKKKNSAVLVKENVITCLSQQSHRPTRWQ